MSLSINESFETKIAPDGVTASVHGTSYPECGVLVWDDIVFVFGVRGLVLGWDVDVFDWEEGGDGCW